MADGDNTRGIVFRVERFAIHDGPGIRTTVFLKGCPLRCAWCHSPESQSLRPELMPPPDRCIACGACVEACPAHAIAGPGGPTDTDACTLCRTCVRACPTGTRSLAGDEMRVRDVIDLIERDRVFYDESGGGATISGGEPLMQPAFVEALVAECRARKLHVAVDTSGYGAPEALARLHPNLFLFDLKAVDEAQHERITGVPNRLILENLARVAERSHNPWDVGPKPSAPRNVGPGSSDSQDVGPGSSAGVPGAATALGWQEGVPGAATALGCRDPGRPFPPAVIVRFPMIPGLNDDEFTVADIGRTVSSLGLERIDVLPYHRAGIAKYERLGRPYPLMATEPPSWGEVARVVEQLSAYGLTVRVGGS